MKQKNLNCVNLVIRLIKVADDDNQKSLQIKTPTEINLSTE